MGLADLLSGQAPVTVSAHISRIGHRQIVAQILPIEQKRKGNSHNSDKPFPVKEVHIIQQRV
jgi:hypothetical protein